jgi:hypothetical protein
MSDRRTKKVNKEFEDSDIITMSGNSMQNNAMCNDDDDTTNNNFHNDNNDTMNEDENTASRSPSLLPPCSSSPPVLPSGQIIDAKNTLQSFDSDQRSRVPVTIKRTGDWGSDRTTTATTATRTDPVLPTGEVINAKNINQAYHVPNNIATTNTNNFDHRGRLNIDRNDATGHIADHDDNNFTTYNVHAVVVPSVVLVDAEPLSQIRERQRPVRSASFWILICLVVVASSAIAAGVGVYCGSGKCNTSSGPSSMSSNGGNSLESPQQPPTISPPIMIPPSPTFPPTSLPISTSELLITFINNITLSGRNLTMTGTTPEDAALQWMVDSDVALWTIPLLTLDSTTSNSLNSRVSQRYALLTMWFQQTNQSKWIGTSGWLTDSDECNWFGITCESTKLLNAVSIVDFYDENTLTSNNYVGTLSADLGLITSIRSIDFKHNNLMGTLPESIGRWTLMESFHVYNNSLTGTLPQSIEQWTNVLEFYPSTNALTGALPESIGQWPILRYFDVSVNTLVGTLPQSIGNWTALNSFYVYKNSFSGTLPVSVVQWTMLSWFGASTSGLLGTLPELIGQWSSLLIFDVSNNSLNGTIPSSIGSWSQITRMSWNGNQFIGTVPNEICNAIQGTNAVLIADCPPQLVCTCCTNNCT